MSEQHLDGDPINDGYTANAEYWVRVVRSKSDRYYQELTEPALLAAIGSCEGLDILDAGCGEGSFARRLLDLGASTVNGVDACLPLIEAARGHSGGSNYQGLRFWHADVAKLPLHERSIDLVVANRIPHALENPELRFYEYARVLRPQGRIVLLSQHPCFYGAKRNADGSIQPPRVPEYFQRRVIERHFSVNGNTSPKPSVQPFYSLEAYIKMVVSAGFAVTAIDEPHPTSVQLREPWWSASFTTPMFLLVTARLL